MAKHLEKFTAAFQHSTIPFLLAEVLTNGRGEMVDLVFRFLNAPAEALLNAPAEALRGQRLTRAFPTLSLEPLRPLQSVAFSGSAASFDYTTLLGKPLTVTCYQPMYGLAACVLEPRRQSPARETGEVPLEHVPGAAAVLRLGRGGARCLSFNRRLCALSGWTRRELLDRFCEDLSALVDPADWPALLQDLLDAGREGRAVDRDLRLLRKSGGPVWVNLRAEVLSAGEGGYTFYAVLLDVDAQRRSQARLQETLGQLEAARRQTDQLFDNLPGGYALLRQGPGGGPPEPLRLSRGLAELLGYPAGELLRHLAADPLWRIPAADREELTAAAVRARNAGRPLRHTCRVRPKGGGSLLMSLEAVWQPQSDGGWLVYVACADVTRQREAEAELQFRSQLCDLLLDRSRILSFDYDPASDTARLERYGAGGRRTVRTLSPYLASLGEAGTVHPDDWKKVDAAIRRAAARPGTETLEYRADYDGQGWRWYRMSWVSLFDGRGNVYRLLGKAEDISDRVAAAGWFRSLADRQRTLFRDALTAARLDLSANRLLDARGADHRLTRVLFSNTADECIAHVQGNLPDPGERARFAALFERQVLLDAFQQGSAHFGLEHRFTVSDGDLRWVWTMAELAENPDTGHVEAFCCTVDIDRQHRQGPLLQALLERDYDEALTVDVRTALCRGCAGDGPARPYGDFLARLAPPAPEALSLDAVTARLETAPVYTLDAPPHHIRCSWLDRASGLLLVTVQGLSE